MRITINDDTTFLTCDEQGDVPAGLELGLYYQDIRFLSRYELRLDGQRPLLLAARGTDYCAAIHFLANPVLPNISRGQIGIIRRRGIGPGLTETIEVTNYGDQAAEFTLDLRFDADFAHVFEIKRNIEFHQESLRRRGDYSLEVSPDGRALRFRNERGALVRETTLALSMTPSAMTPSAMTPSAMTPSATGHMCHYPLRLAAHERWCLELAFGFASSHAHPDAGQVAPDVDVPPASTPPMVRPGAGIVLRAPAVTTDSFVLDQGYEQSVRDYAALRLESETSGDGEFVIAAGIPWFMTLFGRDSLIAAYQALPIFPEAAKGVLRALARFQGTKVDHARGEQPGKILHEYRVGAGSGALRVLSMFPYYGSVDATPLFLMVLAAVYRVTGDLELVRTLREPALRALAWMERDGDRDGDGYIEYLRETEAGLRNQGWKDSFDAIRFRDGRPAQGPIALCEVQGYAYAARIGLAEISAALGDRELANKLVAQAAALKQRFNRDFWLPDRNYYALALDGDKRPVDSITSNPGHLLWTGIADADKAALVAQRLLSPELFSGWGIRTMATTEGGYNPLSYHCGSVWPHDTSLIVAGLARYGFTEGAAKVSNGLLTALRFYSDHRLPELFAGYSTSDAPFPVEYPTANRPQAWASGSIFLLVGAMLGLDASASGLKGQPFLPEAVRRLCLEGAWANRGRMRVAVEHTGRGAIARHMRRLPEPGRRWPWSAPLPT
ncbi:MAG: amylo-alpha-1,6-glucosidase [Ktedonobacterales bacterium]|nr:amylo-alpha-1,6-glucosidase [Ktedonobacterales bacterium]